MFVVLLKLLYFLQSNVTVMKYVRVTAPETDGCVYLHNYESTIIAMDKSTCFTCVLQVLSLVKRY